MRKTPVSGFPRALLSLSHARKRRALASRLLCIQPAWTVPKNDCASHELTRKKLGMTTSFHSNWGQFFPKTVGSERKGQNHSGFNSSSGTDGIVFFRDNSPDLKISSAYRFGVTDSLFAFRTGPRCFYVFNLQYCASAWGKVLSATAWMLVGDKFNMGCFIRWPY